MLAFSYWEKQKLEGFFDYTIVGGGFVGASLALQLIKAQPGKRILLIEEKSLGATASTKNAGFLCLGGPSELSKDLVSYGEKQVHELFLWKWQGAQQWLKTFGSRRLEAKLNGGFDVITHETLEDYDMALNKLDTLNSIAKEVTKIYPFFKPQNDKQSYFGDFEKAISIAWEGQLNPMKALDSIYLLIQNLGVTVLNGYKYTGHNVESNGQTVLIAGLGAIKSRHLCFTTNAHTKQLIPEINIIPGRGLVMVSQELNLQPFKANYHFNAGYTYYRMVGRRLLIGGGRNIDFEAEETIIMGINADIEKFLTSFSNKHIFAEKPVSFEHKWNGFMGFTSNGKPVMQNLGNGVFVFAGLNGMGVAMSPFFAKKAASMVLKQKKK